jgi:hypothetical protein
LPCSERDAGVGFADNRFSVDALIAGDEDLRLKLDRLIDALSRAAYHYWRTREASATDDD